MSYWKNSLVDPNTTLRETIKVLHEGELWIALVVDERNKLLGTVTDGDIRRALVNNIAMNARIELVMNDRPFTVGSKTSKKEILSLMKSKDFLHVPIVDEDGILKDLETLRSLQKIQVYDNPVFLMAGGFGTRLHPLTKEMPKPLLRIGNRPILETIMDQFIEHGFHNFYISTHFMPKKIMEYFEGRDFHNISVQFIHEDKPLGTAGALGLLPDNLPDLPIIMMNGDLLTNVDFNQLLAFHQSNKADSTMCVREYDFQVPYGVIKINGHKIREIEEKPVHKFFVNAGIYVLNRHLINKVDGKTYLDITDFLENELDSGGVNAFPIHEYWLDIGRMDEYERANRDFHTIF